MPPPKQHSLFDAGEPERSIRVVEILNHAKPADKAQAAFRRLVTQIEEQRTLLQGWQSYLTRYNNRIGIELLPVQNELWQQRRRMALLLDELLANPGAPRKKRQRAKLQQMLIELIQNMLIERADAELQSIHDKHSDFAYADDQEMGMALSQDMIESVLGIRMDDQHGAKSMEELFAKAQQELLRRDERSKLDKEEWQTSKRKNRKAEEAQEKKEQAAREISQSVRDVYRKLASALHPDRELDAAAKQRKTEQMQRVNQAYESGNLLELLNLQLEIEQIDAAHLGSLSAQRLAHYNAVLREQLTELKGEIRSITAPFQMLVPFSGYLVPEMIDRSLSEEIARVALYVEQIKGDLEDFKDPAKLAAALKDYEPDDGFDDFADLSFLLDTFAVPSAKAKRKKRRK